MTASRGVHRVKIHIAVLTRSVTANFIILLLIYKALSESTQSYIPVILNNIDPDALHALFR